jgi:hypothetical protein
VDYIRRFVKYFLSRDDDDRVPKSRLPSCRHAEVDFYYVT